MTIPPKRSITDKHGIVNMPITTANREHYLDFPIRLYQPIRNATNYQRKKHNKLYITRQVINSIGKKIVRVWRKK